MGKIVPTQLSAIIRKASWVAKAYSDVSVISLDYCA